MIELIKNLTDMNQLPLKDEQGWHFGRVAKAWNDIKPADPEWTMSQEREFIENLVNQRFSYFCVLYAVIIGGAFAANSVAKAIAILLIGVVLLGLAAWPIRRANDKLHFILKILHRTHDHPVRFIGKLADDADPLSSDTEVSHRETGVTKPLDVVGWIVPLLACISIVVLAALMYCQVI